MTIEASVAHAIHAHLDIVGCCPEIHDIGLEELEPFAENYVHRVQEEFTKAVTESEDQIDNLHAFTASVLKRTSCVPPDTCLKMCRTIRELRNLDVKFIGDHRGHAWYLINLSL